MRCRPAGTDTSDRSSGTHRQMSTATVDRSANQASARSRSFGFTPSQRPWRAASRWMRVQPRLAATRYSAQAPSTEPMVAASTIPHRLADPLAALKPAAGSTISEGMGGKMFSTAVSSRTPR